MRSERLADNAAGQVVKLDAEGGHQLLTADPALTRPTAVETGRGLGGQKLQFSFRRHNSVGVATPGWMCR